jgi:hypothetical protein
VPSIVISKFLHYTILENFNLKWTRIQCGVDLGCSWMLFFLLRKVCWPALEECYVGLAKYLVNIDQAYMLIKKMFETMPSIPRRRAMTLRKTRSRLGHWSGLLTTSSRKSKNSINIVVLLSGQHLKQFEKLTKLQIHASTFQRQLRGMSSEATPIVFGYVLLDVKSCCRMWRNSKNLPGMFVLKIKSKKLALAFTFGVCL